MLAADSCGIGLKGVLFEAKIDASTKDNISDDCFGIDVYAVRRIFAGCFEKQRFRRTPCARQMHNNGTPIFRHGRRSSRRLADGIAQ